MAKLVELETPGNPVPVQFNALGASCQERGALPELRSRGVLRLRLRGSLPQSLDLYAEITENHGGGVSAGFVSLLPVVGELIQQLYFINHRQRFVVSRNSRNK